MREFFRRSSSGPARDGLTLHEPSTREWGRTPEQVAYALGLLKKMRSALDNQNGQQMFDTLLSAMQEAVDAAREGKIEKDQRGYLRDCARSLWSSGEIFNTRSS